MNRGCGMLNQFEYELVYKTKLVSAYVTRPVLCGFICTHYQHDTLDKTDNKRVRSTVPPWREAKSASAKIASDKTIIEGWEEK